MPISLYGVASINIRFSVMSRYASRGVYLIRSAATNYYFSLGQGCTAHQTLIHYLSVMFTIFSQRIWLTGCSRYYGVMFPWTRKGLSR